jgi:hypothetical protein
MSDLTKLQATMAGVLLAVGLSTLRSEGTVRGDVSTSQNAAAVHPGGARERGQGDEAGEEALSPDLALVPGDALAFVHVRLAALWETEFGKKVRRQVGKELALADEEALKRLGVPLKSIERATLIWRSLKDDSPLVVVAMIEPYNRQKILESVLPDPERHRYKDAFYYTSKRSGRACLYFVNDRVYEYGLVEDVVEQLTRLTGRGAGEPPSAIMDLASEKHHVLAGINVPQDVASDLKERLANQKANQSLESAVAQSLKPLLEMRSASVAIDCGAVADVRARLVFSSEAEAKEAMWPTRDWLALARLGMGFLVGQIRLDIRQQDLQPLLKPLEAALRTAAVEQHGAMVQGTLRLPGESAVLVKALPGLLQGQIKGIDDKAKSADNLKQLALAMHNYHDAHGSFPAAAIYSKDGKPLLSWRVAILPFIDQDRLHKQFKLDEPWDSAHNKALLSQMPRIFAAPVRGAAAMRERTHYQVFVGKGTVFDGTKGRSISEITFGTSNTLLIVEAKNPVPWTKPEDLPFDPRKPLPELGGLFADGFHVTMCNGAVRFFARTIKEDMIRAMIPRGAGAISAQ